MQIRNPGTSPANDGIEEWVVGFRSSERRRGGGGGERKDQGWF